MKTILFVCTGNTCRSPMAEGIFNVLARGSGINARACSRGVSVWARSPATPDAVDAAAAYGANISSHESRMVTEDIVDAADAVYCMTESHRAALERMYPRHSYKLYLLSEDGVPDPFLGGAEVYAAAAGKIESALRKIVKSLERGDFK
ncbi:protein-tyrosine-phosphatase [Clostridia bacterium]|nr:protein-tyrosine-phosphatase [Clostridia bacterium]